MLLAVRLSLQYDLDSTAGLQRRVFKSRRHQDGPGRGPLSIRPGSPSTDARFSTSYVRILMLMNRLMNTRGQRLMRDLTCWSILNGLTSAALGICLLLGPGFQVSNLIGDLSSPKSGSYFQQSYQSDSAVSRLEKQVTASDKSPRRQTSFGALPNAVEQAVCNVTVERTSASFWRDSLTAASHQKDRAPPS